jgi:hypothetical protein
MPIIDQVERDFSPDRWRRAPLRLPTLWDSAEQTCAMRVEIHVRPNASTTGVGGEYDGALVVRVVEPADRGRATDAALAALANALRIPRRSVSLVRGATARRKLIEIDDGATNEDLMTELVGLRKHFHER